MGYEIGSCCCFLYINRSGLNNIPSNIRGCRSGTWSEILGNRNFLEWFPGDAVLWLQSDPVLWLQGDPILWLQGDPILWLQGDPILCQKNMVIVWIHPAVTSRILDNHRDGDTEARETYMVQILKQGVA